MPVDIPKFDYRTCSHCLVDENSSEFEKTCPDPGAANGKHKLVRRYLWFGVVVDHWFGVTSKREARDVFGESCYTSDFYLIVERFDKETIEALRQNKAELVLRVVPKGEK
jgi:hypothetical protein